MTRITRRQVMQLLIDCDIQPRLPEQIGQWQKFAEAVLLKFGEPKWQLIETAPRNGRFFIAVDVRNPESMSVVNWPIGCAIGSWFYDESLKEWMGASSKFSRYDFTHWREAPAHPR